MGYAHVYVHLYVCGGHKLGTDVLITIRLLYEGKEGLLLEPRAHYVTNLAS